MLILTAFLLVCLQAQQPEAAKAALKISGDILSPLTLSAEDIRAMPRGSVQFQDQGVTKKYEGVWLHDVLRKAGAPMGNEAHGKALATYVVATARDGYQVVFSLGELDPAFRDNEILLADTIDGQPLSERQGPFRIVVPHDKRGARSVRMLNEIQVVRLGK